MGVTVRGLITCVRVEPALHQVQQRMPAAACRARPQLGLVRSRLLMRAQADRPTNDNRRTASPLESSTPASPRRREQKRREFPALLRSRSAPALLPTEEREVAGTMEIRSFVKVEFARVITSWPIAEALEPVRWETGNRAHAPWLA